MSTQQERLDNLLQAVAGLERILILPHNDPDPDAIASAVALRYLLAKKAGVAGQIAYKGIIGRAENKALVRHLGRPLRRLGALELDQQVAVALVDTQPNAGNNPWPPERVATLVIDHHPHRTAAVSPLFADVRPGVGATSTMLTEYLQAAQVEPPPALATALFYGIRTDTTRLGHSITSADVMAYVYLQARMDVDALVQIERAQVPAAYFKSFDAALRAARVYDGVVISYIGHMSYPDLAAEMADLLLRLQGAQWVMCLGVYKEQMSLAVRCRQRRGAGQLAQHVVEQRGEAGGHSNMAGGHIPLRGEDPERLAQDLTQRALHYLQVGPELTGQPLLA